MAFPAATGLTTAYVSSGSGVPSTTFPSGPAVQAAEYALYQDTATGLMYYWNRFTAAWSSFGGGGSDVPILDYITTTDVATGLSVSTGAWTDVIPNQSFTVASGSSKVEVSIGGHFRFGASGGGALATRLVIDSAGTPINKQLGGSLADAQMANALAGAPLVNLGSLSAGAHTVKVQAYASFVAASVYIRTATYPNAEFVTMRVYERL